ncbi:hypothetical protein LOZ65_001459 [Ophidiomyces ophidiicola]|nr:hypothetical protein LOZ65_001459 [Ophidiomyces ophidiicola]
MSASQRPTAPQPSSASAPRVGQSTNPSIPRPPLSVHPTATISETAYFQGKHSINIGAGTVIHPRAKILSFEGPINLGEGCIIGEKAVIGGPLPAASLTSSTGTDVTTIENSVHIGPLATINSGSHIHSAAVIESSAIIGRQASIGRHAKVCALCEIPDNGNVEDWIVVWGGGAGGMGTQKRKRANGRNDDENTIGLNGRAVEVARLAVLSKERETLAKLIGAGATATSRRR